MFGTLRTLLALNVVLLHIFNVPVLGNYSVSFFFVLSGFLMTYIMQNTYGFSLKGIKVFWLNRLLRLYPIYWVLLIVTIVVLSVIPGAPMHKHMSLPNTFFEWFVNITMYYPNIIPHKIEPRLIPPSWALTNELTFYLLISLGLSKTKTRTLIWLFLSVVYYILTYLYYDIPTFRYSAILASSLPFALGASIYWLRGLLTFKIKPVYALALYILFLFKRSL